jgi:hypothetical protein
MMVDQKTNVKAGETQRNNENGLQSPRAVDIFKPG